MQNKINAIAQGGASLQNLLIGMLLVFMSSFLLISNEIDSIQYSQMMNQGVNDVIRINVNDPINKTNDGKLVYISGVAMTMDSLQDDYFNITARGIRLWRIVQMYQWKEQKDSDSNDTTYVTEWSNKHIVSTDSAHENPILFIQGQSFNARNVGLGNFTLSHGLITQMSNWQKLAISDTNIPHQYKDKMKAVGDMLYLGKNPENPEIGDLKISFSYIEPGLISVVAKQNNKMLEPFGVNDNAIAFVESGSHPVEALFQSDKKNNAFSSWFKRIGGFIFMLVAAFLLQTSLISLLGKLTGTNAFHNLNSKAITLLLGAIMFFIAIAVGWVSAYVPFVKYIILGLFLVGFGKVALKVFKQLNSSKSIFAQIMLILLTLIIILIILVIVVFIYLTRAG